jgi:signal transduction histidine kinase
LAADRIAQAACENIERHAGADNVKVSLAASARAVALDISDDGVGLDPADAERAARGGHLGLVDMRRQAELVGALLEIDGRPDEGTRISFRWPG